MSGRFALMARGARTTPALSLLVIVVVAVLSFLGVVAPALLAQGRTSTVQHAVASVPALTRWPSATAPGLPASDEKAHGDGGVWARALSAAEATRQKQPQPLRGLLGAPRVIVMADPLATVDEDPDRTAPVPFNKVGLVADPGLLRRAELIEGALPEFTGPAESIQIVLTRTVADQLQWEIGAERRQGERTLLLTGLVAPSGRDDGDWTFINGSVEPLIETDGSGNRILVVAAFMNIAQTTVFVDDVRDVKHTSWMPFDTSRLDADQAETVAAQLRRLSTDPARIPMFDTTFYDRGLEYRSSLPQTIESAVIRADAMSPVLTVAAVGPITVALVVLALLSRLIAVRRVGAVRLLRARGASAGRLVALLGGEGLVLGVLGGVAGAGGAVLGSGAGPSGAWVLAVPALLASVPTICVPWNALRDARRQGRHDLGEAGPRAVGRVPPGRATAETVILAVTAGLAVLIALRGEGGGADPLLIALYVLIGVSGSILALRLLPMLLRVAERRGGRHASLTSLLGPARARRDAVVRAAPVLAVVVGLGAALFGIAFTLTVSTGIVRSAAIGVGADVRVDAAYITQAGADRVAELDGVAEVAALRGGTTADVSADTRTVRSRVYAIDRDRLAAVQHGTDAEIPLAAALAEPTDAAVPVVVSEKLLAMLGGGAAEGKRIEIGGVRARVVGVAPSRSPFGSAEQWLVVDDANAAALLRGSTGISQLYLALEPETDPDVLGAAAVDAIGGDAAFLTPAQVAADHAADPAYGVVRATLLAASVLAAGLLGLSVVAALLLGAGSRARTLSILRTLGPSRGVVGTLVAWEVVPALATALPFGTGAGLALSWWVIPQLDLRGFVGGTAQPPVVVDGAWLLLTIAAFGLLASAAVAVASLLATRLSRASMIGPDDEAER